MSTTDRQQIQLALWSATRCLAAAGHHVEDAFEFRGHAKQVAESTAEARDEIETAINVLQDLKDSIK